jgi:hypothetical protein
MSVIRLDRNVSIQELASSITRKGAIDERHTDHEPKGTAAIEGVDPD